MELRVLEYFLMVAREENITKAAQLLHITQPTLSRQLMQLEEELGVKLFERNRHHIQLTDEGLLLKRRAQEIVALAEKARKELSDEKHVSGEIEIGSGEFKSFSFFADIMSEFMKIYPNVSFKFYSGNADNIKERLENGLSDIGLLADPVDVSKYEFVRLPQKEIWGLLIHQDSKLAKKEFIMPEDLCGMSVIMPHRRLVQEELKGWLGDAYDRMRITAIYDLLYNAAIMARKKMGAVFTIDLGQRFDDLKFIPLKPALEFGSLMVWKKNRVQSSAAEAFCEYFKQCVKSINENAI